MAALVLALGCAAGALAPGGAEARTDAAEASTYAAGKVVIRVSPSVARAAAASGHAGDAWTGDSALDGALRAAGMFSARPLLPHPARPAHPAARPAELDRYWRVRFAGPRDPQAVARALATAPGVELAEAVPVCRVARVPNDPSLPAQWAFSEPSAHGVNAQSAWDSDVGDESVTIGVLDTGVDWQHPDLGGPAPYTAGNIWTNAAELNGIAGVDDDANGYIDDIRGWDFVDDVPVYPGEDGSTPDNDPSDFDGHGTHIAGIMAALTDNATGVAGVTWRCKLVPLRMGYAGTDPYSGNEAAYVQMDFAAEAMTYAADRGVAAVNCSWGSNSFTPFATAVSYALSAGVAVVDAAGNGDSDSQLGNYLAQRGDCIDVAAVDSLDQRASFSSYGAWVDISAPGLGILSTYFDRVSGAHTYATLSGTSQAAPFVTAAAALWRSAHPADSLDGFRHRVLATATSIDDFNAPDMRGLLGSGRLDLGAMLDSSTSAWQVPAGDSVTTSVALGDLGPNRRGAAVAVTARGTVVALGRGGAPLPGWPVSAMSPGGDVPAPTYAPATLGRLGTTQAVAVASSDGVVHAWNAAGAPLSGQWPRHLDGAIRGGAAAGMVLPGSGGALVVGTEVGSVWALDSTGTELPNWPQDLDSPVRATPTLVDLTGDGTRNIVAATAGGCVYAWDGGANLLAGWPVCASDAAFALPIAAGAASGVGSTVLVGMSSDNRVFVWNRSGTLVQGWPVQLPGTTIPQAPVLADLTLDGWLEIVAATGTKIYAFRGDGTPVAGWPQTLPARIAATPVVADLDGNGVNDIIAACADGRVYAFTPSGAAVPGWPRATSGAIEGAPAVGDAGGDGIPDLVVGSDDGWLYSWPLPGGLRGPDLLQWPMAGHDAARSSRHSMLSETPVRAPHDDRGGALVLRFVRAAPGGALDLAWSGAPAAGARDARLELFDVRGRSVATRALGAAEVARGAVRWHAGTRQRGLGAGVYLARLLVGGASATTRLVLLP